MYTNKQILDGYESGIFTVREVFTVARLGTAQNIALFFGVTVRTVQRWIQSNKMPRAVLLACRARAGDMSVMGQAGIWSTFCVIDDYLQDDYGNRISKADILKHNARMYQFVTMQHELEMIKEKDKERQARAAALLELSDNVVLFRHKKDS